MVDEEHTCVPVIVGKLPESAHLELLLKPECSMDGWTSICASWFPVGRTDVPVHA